MRRVAHASTPFSADQTFVVDTMRGVEGAGWESWLVTTGPADPERLPFPSRDRILMADLPSGLQAVGGKLLMRTSADRRSLMVEPLLREIAPDVVHGHFGWSAANARLAARRLDVPFVTTFPASDILIWPGVSRMYRDYRKLFRELDAVMAVSEFVADCLRSRGCDLPIDVVPCGVRVEDFKFRPPPPSDEEIRLVFVGRLAERKGLDVILRALPAVLARHPSVRLEVVGDGEERGPSEELARSLGVDRRVSFLGAGPPAGVYGTLSRGHAFVMASRTMPNGEAEGSPVVTKEAQAVGLPVVATASPGTVETIAPAYRQELVPENHPDAFAAAVISLIDDRASWEERARIGRDWVEQAFDWQMLAGRISAIYERAIETRRSGVRAA